MPTVARRLTGVALFVVAILALGDKHLAACSCAPASPCQATWAAHLTFVGKVETIEKLTLHTAPRPFSYSRRVRLRVVEQFTGEAATDVDIFTNDQTASCGYPFQTNQTYLVYAYKDAETGLLSTSICSRTTLAGLNADRGYLRGLAANETTARLKGEVSRQPASGKREVLAGTEVSLEGLGSDAARRYTAVTEANGRFEVQVAQGRYRVSVALPPDLWSPEIELALFDPRGCREVPISARPNGRIHGRVLDARGNVVPYLPIDVMAPQNASSHFAMPMSNAITDPNGTFEVVRLPPASYALGLHLTRLDNQSTGSFWFVL